MTFRFATALQKDNLYPVDPRFTNGLNTWLGQMRLIGCGGPATPNLGSGRRDLLQRDELQKCGALQRSGSSRFSHYIVNRRGIPALG